MKKLLLLIYTIPMLLVGCKTVPTVESMSKIGLSSGYTTAFILNNQSKITSDVKMSIITIISDVQKYTPETNSTYTITWTPIAKTHILNLIENEKINNNTGDVILIYFSYITTLIDDYIESKDIRQYKELTDAFIHGFCNGFLNNFNTIKTLQKNDQKIDDFTTKRLIELIKKEG